jgi:dipeptidyl aminopeptidase/acylaminoacyl peptidase
MTIGESPEFTPEVLLSSPRCSDGIPSPSGDKVLYNESAYSFEKHEKKSRIMLLDVVTSETSPVVEDEGYSNVSAVKTIS